MKMYHIHLGLDCSGSFKRGERKGLCLVSVGQSTEGPVWQGPVWHLPEHLAVSLLRMLAASRSGFCWAAVALPWP